jgi:hypothetical protein
VYVLTIARPVANYERLGNTPTGCTREVRNEIEASETEERCTVISARESDLTIRVSMIFPRTSVGWRAIHSHEPAFCSKAAQAIALA